MNKSSNRWQYIFQVLLILISLTTLLIVAQAWWMGFASQGWGTLLVLLIGAIFLFLVAHQIAEKIVSASLGTLNVEGQSWEETAAPKLHYKVRRRSVKEALISSLPNTNNSN